MKQGDKVIVTGLSVGGHERVKIGTEATILFGSERSGFGIEGFLYNKENLTNKEEYEMQVKANERREALQSIVDAINHF